MGGGETYKARHTKPTQQQWSDQRMTKVSRSPGNLCLSQPPRKEAVQNPPSAVGPHHIAHTGVLAVEPMLSSPGPSPLGVCGTRLSFTSLSFFSI